MTTRHLTGPSRCRAGSRLGAAAQWHLRHGPARRARQTLIMVYCVLIQSAAVIPFRCNAMLKHMAMLFYFQAVSRMKAML